MYRPTILLPSDDYRGGSLLLMMAASLGICVEFAAYLTVGILCWLFAEAHITRWIWGSFLLLPLILFDIVAATLGVVTFAKCYKLVVCLFIDCHILIGSSFLWIVGVCVLSYGGQLTLLWLVPEVRSPRVYVRLHVWDLWAVLLTVSIYLKLSGLVSWSWVKIFWPCWVFLSFWMAVSVLAYWHVGPYQFPLVRILIVIFVSTTISFMIFLKQLSEYLNGGKVSRRVG